MLDHRSVWLTVVAMLSACVEGGEVSPRAILGGDLRIEQVSPLPGARLVPTAAEILLTFNVAPAAEQVRADALRLFSGVAQQPLQLRVDLIERKLIGQPLRPLRSDLRYRVFLREGLRALDGTILAEAFDSTFVTGREPGDPPPPPAPITLEQLQPLWQRRCVACHHAAAAAGGVDLSTPNAARTTLVGQPSSWPGLDRVHPGSHALSYLMRKLLGPPGIVGFRMPPAPQAPLSAEDLRQVADWIDGGAE